MIELSSVMFSISKLRSLASIKKVFEKAAVEGAQAVIISAEIEAEVAQLESDEERQELLES